MASILTQVTDVVGNLIATATTIVTTVVANPLLLLFTCIAVAFSGVRLYKTIRS